MHFAFPRYTTTHICTYLRPSISWSPRPRSDECTLVKQVHALVRHGHTCSPKTCTYIRTYVKHARMYVQKQKHAKRHSQHRHNKKDWFKLLTNAFQILLPRKRGSVTQSVSTNLHCAMPFSASPCRRQPLHWFYKKARKHTNIHT